MTEFVQLHLLTSYPPANLNRDDLGRPKTAQFGGDLRLRVSSQCLKRTWRKSEVFAEAVGANGKRTKLIGHEVLEQLLKAGIDETKAHTAAERIAERFGELDKSKSPSIKQLCFFDAREQAAVNELVGNLTSDSQLLEKLLTQKADKKTKKKPIEILIANGTIPELLRPGTCAPDIALFGRMLAAVPHYNVEAAVQVAHAITVHRTAVEDDYFTAVDDVNLGGEDRGAGHVGEAGFGAGVFYVYVCIDRDQLVRNLQAQEDKEDGESRGGKQTDGGDKAEALADRAISGLVRAATTVAPRGKQNSFGSRAYASYVLAERGEAQPRSLSVAFLDAIGARGGHLRSAITRLEETRDRLDAVYGPTARARYVLNAEAGTGRLEELVTFCTGAPETAGPTP